jgi:hypothetical protein
MHFKLKITEISLFRTHELILRLLPIAILTFQLGLQESFRASVSQFCHPHFALTLENIVALQRHLRFLESVDQSGFLKIMNV